MEADNFLINFPDAAEGSCEGPSHNSPVTPQIDRSLLDEDTGMEQPFIGAPILSSESRTDDLAVLVQAIDSLKSVFVDTVDRQKKWLQDSTELCTHEVPKKTLTVVEKAHSEFLDVLSDRMKEFTKHTIEAIQWNSKQTHNEFKAMFDEANSSMFSSFKRALEESRVGEKTLQEEVCSLRKELVAMQTSLDSFMQQRISLDTKVDKKVLVSGSQVCSNTSSHVDSSESISQPALSNLACGRIPPIKMVFPTFGGVNDESDPVIYLERCNDFLALRPMSNSEILATMRSVLHASARDWWETVRFKINSWGSFQKAFLAVFLPEDYQDVLEEKVRNRLQGTNESVRDFAFSFQALFKRWKKEATDTEVLKALLKAMNPCYASQLRGRAQTVEELVRLGTQLERDYDHKIKYNQLQLPKSSFLDQHLSKKSKGVEVKSNLPPEHSLTSLLCWRCHENHSPGSCSKFKAVLSGKQTGGQFQGTKEFQPQNQQRGMLSAYDTQRFEKKDVSSGRKLDKRDGIKILRQLVIPMMVRNCSGKALVDTGATYTLLNVDLWNKIKEPNERLDVWHEGPLYLANGDATVPLGQKVLDFYLQDLHFQVPTVVLPAQNLVYSMVLGLDFIALTGLQLNIKDQLYSFSDDPQDRVFPFQPPITPGDSWKCCKPPGNYNPSASLYSAIPPVQFVCTTSECVDKSDVGESGSVLMELLQSKIK